MIVLSSCHQNKLHNGVIRAYCEFNPAAWDVSLISNPKVSYKYILRSVSSGQQPSKGVVLDLFVYSKSCTCHRPKSWGLFVINGRSEASKRIFHSIDF